MRKLLICTPLCTFSTFQYMFCMYTFEWLYLQNCSRYMYKVNTVMILSFRTDRPGQTVQTLIRVYTVCHSVCIVWTHYSMVEPHSSNFRVITTNILGVRIFRKFTVVSAFLRLVEATKCEKFQIARYTGVKGGIFLISPIVLKCEQCGFTVHKM